LLLLLLLSQTAAALQMRQTTGRQMTLLLQHSCRCRC
jgi:hypothetical protein